MITQLPKGISKVVWSGWVHIDKLVHDRRLRVLGAGSVREPVQLAASGHHLTSRKLG